MTRVSGAGQTGRFLPERLRAHWLERGWIGEGKRVAVATSGGVDSLVLLHLLRFPLRDLGLRLEAAHFEHRMRPEGGAEAFWLSGVAGAWGLPLHLGAAKGPLRSEAEARAERYRFLEGLLSEGGVDWVLTAHQADDQVETILFRVLRGTGIEGLVGIPELRAPGILRPLLPFTRGEIEEYARRHHLRPRIDPTNRSARFARGRVRHRLLPLLEEIHPGARSGILRLGANAEDAARALELLLASRMEWIRVREEEGQVDLDRARLLAEPEPIRVELVRSVARSLGQVLSRSGTDSLLQFMTEGASGGSVMVEGRLQLSRDFDRLRMTMLREGRPDEGEPGSPDSGAAPGDAPLVLSSLADGDGSFAVGGRRFEARWGSSRGSETGGWEEAHFNPGALRLPLTLRGWRDGDRTRTGGGGRKVKKVLGELRIPRRDRSRLPLLVDAAGEVLWIPGLHRSPMAGEARESAGPEVESHGSWRVRVRNVDPD